MLRVLVMLAPRLILLLPVLAAQARPLEVVRDSVVGPHGGFRVLTDLIALDSSKAVLLDFGLNVVGIVETGSPTLRPFGRKGTGPGEFNTPTHIGRHGDSIWIADLFKPSVQLLPLNGARGTSRPWQPPDLDQVTDWRLLGVQRDGSLLLTMDPPDGRIQDSLVPRMPVLVQRAGTTTWKEVATLGHSAKSGIDIPVLGDVITMTSPLATADHALARRDGSGFVIVREHAVPAGVRPVLGLEVYNDLGTLVSKKSVTLATPQTDPHAADDVLTQSVQLAMGTYGNRTEPRTIERSIRQQVGQPREWPVTSLQVAASDGTIWLRLFGSPSKPSNWLVVEPMSGSVRTVTLPLYCTFRDAVQGVLWLICKERDLPLIRRARILRSPNNTRTKH